MKRKIITTADGSTTIHLPDWNEQYHSKHGAIQEAYHVFINTGLHHFISHKSISEIESESKVDISILEIGLGTGLNAFITLLEAEKLKLNINYVGIEGYPVPMEEVEQLNYTSELKVEDKSHVFLKLHELPWGTPCEINQNFSLTKEHKMFDTIMYEDTFHLIYFDAFGARVQPELWTTVIFENMYTALKKGGVLVTYAARGSVRRAMQAVGFSVEKLPGPPGKREMLRATK